MVTEKDLKKYREKADKRIAHLIQHTSDRDGVIEDMVHKILHNLGSPHGCAMGLSSDAEANAMLSWFGNHDLHAMKQWCYVTSKLDQLWYQMIADRLSAGGCMLRLLKPLLSDHEALINWFAHYDSLYDLKRVENHKTGDFFAYQTIVALRGDWPRLIERCEKVIADPPGASSEQKYLIDHHFFLALAHGDIEKMQDVLQEILTPKAVRVRRNDESGYTEDLISTYAVIYSKIAWRHGYQVKVDSPYIPQEWLPVSPLDHYDNHYIFLKP